MIIDKFWLGRTFRNDEPVDPGAPAADPAPAPDPAEPPADPAPAPDPAEPPAPFYSQVPEDWRAQIVEGLGIEDEAERGKVAKMFDRVTDLPTLARNYVESQNKIRSGLAKDNTLPENPTDEQMAEYRAANGIPESADAYELSLDDGLVLGDDDNRIMGEVFKVAHELNIPAESMSKLTNAMLTARQSEEQAFAQQDGMDRQIAERQLREQWGGDYTSNVNMVNGLLNKLPESIRDEFKSARLANGQALFSSPEAVMFFADMARAVDPSATVVPNSDNPLQSINQEIAKLEERMGTPEWYKDTAAQKRYQDLIEAKGRMG